MANCIPPCEIKNTEGYDRIPQRIIFDGQVSLAKPLEKLFKLVYRDKMVPGQWLISKIIPVHKKVTKIFNKVISYDQLALLGLIIISD